jgi:hypothetical protein
MLNKPNYFKPPCFTLAMEEPYQQQYTNDFSARVRDIEDKLRLLKDRVLLIGQSFIEEKEKSSEDIREIKKNLSKTQAEQERIKEILERITEQLSSVARKEELLILQRQLDMLRK